MRTQNKFKTITVSNYVYNRLQHDRNHFQELINGGKWSLNDTIKEYYKILDLVELDAGRKR